MTFSLPETCNFLDSPTNFPDFPISFPWSFVSWFFLSSVPFQLCLGSPTTFQFPSALLLFVKPKLFVYIYTFKVNWAVLCLQGYFSVDASNGFNDEFNDAGPICWYDANAPANDANPTTSSAKTQLHGSFWSYAWIPNGWSIWHAINWSYVPEFCK